MVYDEDATEALLSCAHSLLHLADDVVAKGELLVHVPRWGNGDKETSNGSLAFVLWNAMMILTVLILKVMILEMLNLAIMISGVMVLAIMILEIMILVLVEW